MRTTAFLLACWLILACTSPKQKLADYPIKPVNLNQVELTDSFWLPKIKTVQQRTIEYAIEKCREEGRMENFLIAGGVMEGQTRGEMPFDDTDLYKIIEGAAYSLVSSPDKELEAYVDSLIAIIAIGQEEDGYLTTWRTINPHEPPAEWVEPGGRWEDLASSHELYNSGHLFEAATAHYYATGKRNFLDIAIKNADLLVDTFGMDKNPEMPGHQIIETGLIKLYQISGEEKYLNLARHFLDHRGDSTFRELFGPYSQDHKPVTEQEEVVGHAVRAMYMYAGMTDIAAIYGDTAYHKAIDNLWNNMVGKKMYITGGIGARHHGESFGDNYELPNLTAYSETCAAIGSVYWNHCMFRLTGDVKYLDVLERTLYNGLISGISLDGDEFFYPNPLESDGEYAFNQGACTRSEWFDCSCCPTNLIRFIPYMPNLVYATQKDTLYVNLFMSNKAKISLGDNTVDLQQNNHYPWKGKLNFTVKPEKAGEFTLKIRIPGWARDEVAPGGLYTYANDLTANPVIRINGEEVENLVPNKGFYTITRTWTGEETIAIDLPMQVRTVRADMKVADNRNKLAVEYGPLVYCAEEADNTEEMDNLVIASESRLKPEAKPELLGGIYKLSNADMNLIPYYAWSNRGVGKMKVWMPEKQ